MINGPVHEGHRVQVDLPEDEHVKNFGAPKPPHAGLCVFATMDMMARWHHVAELIGIIHKLQEGGGWPEKVDQVVKHFAPSLKYIQYEGTSPEILDKAMARRIAVGVTFGFSDRYKGPDGRVLEYIYHMVLLVYMDEKRACILDNNFPGTYEWMARAEFLRRWAHPTGKGWAYLFLVPPPPPFESEDDANAMGDTFAHLADAGILGPGSAIQASMFGGLLRTKWPLPSVPADRGHHAWGGNLSACYGNRRTRRGGPPLCLA